MTLAKRSWQDLCQLAFGHISPRFSPYPPRENPDFSAICPGIRWEYFTFQSAIYISLQSIDNYVESDKCCACDFVAQASEVM